MVFGPIASDLTLYLVWVTVSSTQAAQIPSSHWLQQSTHVSEMKFQRESRFENLINSTANKTSLAIQWLRLCAFTVGVVDFIPGWGTFMIPHAVWPGKKTPPNLQQKCELKRDSLINRNLPSLHTCLLCHPIISDLPLQWLLSWLCEIFMARQEKSKHKKFISVLCFLSPF